MNIVYEVGEPSAAYGHNFSEFVVNQIELPSVEPKAATISAIVQEYLVGLQEPYLIKHEIYAKGKAVGLDTYEHSLVIDAEAAARVREVDHDVPVTAAEENHVRRR